MSPCFKSQASGPERQLLPNDGDVTGSKECAHNFSPQIAGKTLCETYQTREVVPNSPCLYMNHCYVYKGRY